MSSKTNLADKLLIFSSKETAHAIKEIVKKCFIPKHFYPQPNITLSQHPPYNPITNIDPETGPSFFRSYTNSPAKIKPSYIKKAGFVTKKLSRKSLMQAKKQMERTKQQTTKIEAKMGLKANPINIENVLEKVCAKRRTVRSTTIELSSDKLFKKTFAFD